MDASTACGLTTPGGITAATVGDGVVVAPEGAAGEGAGVMGWGGADAGVAVAGAGCCGGALAGAETVGIGEGVGEATPGEGARHAARSTARTNKPVSAT